jgi:hypothetical protein
MQRKKNNVTNKQINEHAAKECLTKDKQYNSGRRLICQYGIENCRDMKDVKYYLSCNGM